MKFPNLLSVAKLWTVLGLFGLVSSPCQAVSVEELRAVADLTPDKFARYFCDFEFELGEKVQSPEVFLSRGAGDCDDYATLAADLLKEKGFTTKLVVVFMPKDIHVVCYVAETKCYLDFNYRNKESRTIPSNGELEDIASKVAKSFKSNWHCVSEFAFKNGSRKFLYTDFPQVKQPAPLKEKKAVAHAIAASNQK